mmetsp:Transcript_24076/g.21132  ORF Transcript_24076/g.21132 Transcript_24076/m.21132 type:complete len:144 (+) Transcript_24076:51-482(+)
MSIFYSLIARNNDTILCEADVSSGNYPQVTLKVLRSNKMSPGFKTFASADYVFYILNEPPYSILCLTESDFSKVKALTFLKELKDSFMQKFSHSERESAIAYSFNSKFESYMKDRMSYFNEASESDSRIQNVVSQMRDVENLV